MYHWKQMNKIKVYTYKHRTPRSGGKTEEYCRNHEHVESVSDERSSGDGIWLYLKPGLLWHGEVSCIHEDTWTECRKALRGVRIERSH